MTDILDPDAIGDTEDPYCEAMPGLAPHNYQPIIDVIAGTGIYMYCTQCGDWYRIDGSEVQQQAPTQAPAPAPTTSRPTGIGSLP